MDRRKFIIGSASCIAMLLTASSSALSGCSITSKSLQEVKDMGGREVYIPTKLERVFCTNPIGTADIYCLNPDLLVGWNFKPSGMSQYYIQSDYLELPSLGVWMGAGNTPNPEEIASQDPDVLLCFWTADETGTDMAEEIRSETSMPVLLIDYDLRNTPEMFRYLGNLFGCSERAEKLALYCEEKISWIQNVVKKVPQSKRKSIYLAQSSGGLSTDPVGSMHVDDALALIGTNNVANLPGTVGAGMGMPTVSIEQIIQWNPDAIFVSEYTMTDYKLSDIYSEIKTDRRWQQVECVKKGNIYSIPQAPFSWFGRPPSVVRLLGCLMLLKILYPSYVKSLDIRQEAKDFYSLFLNYSLSDKQLDELLTNTNL